MAAKLALAIDEMLTTLKGEVPMRQWSAAFALFEAAFAVAVHGTKTVPSELADVAISWQKQRSKQTQQSAQRSHSAGRKSAASKSSAQSKVKKARKKSAKP